MRAPRLEIFAWSTVLLVTVLRAAFARSLPLTGDEAYYWEWSRRLAAGYVDHPPAVAYAIAAFAWAGRSPLAVRAAFVLCGLVTAVATGAAAAVFSGRRNAGAIAALAVSLAPIMNVGFGIATPDGPYALGWSASLFFAARAFRERRLYWFALLGVALGVALLSRLFACALIAGVILAALTPAYRAAWRAGLWMSIGIAALTYAPFLLWNSQHHWISWSFGLFGRHPSDETAPLRPFVLFALNALAFSPGIWIAVLLVAQRCREPLVLWTAVPLALVLFVLSLHERVEVYWFVGPFLSLCAGLGTLQLRRGWAWVWAPAAALSAIVFAAAIAPLPAYSAISSAGLHLSDGGPFEMFTYRQLARDVRDAAQKRSAIVMTDGYGFSSLLDFYADITPVVIGYDSQGAEARRWFNDGDRPAAALFVDKVPLAARPDFTLQFDRACARVSPGPVLQYRYRRYFTTWCEGMSRNAVATLRWQKT
ncbi:MAG TPA: glycosyltransferase family 39 protein [Candidatus Baltobacteraceae bacterium]|jgi:4-amino-4-deoxy-L-arabinose transferase-like glycosyltransferase|nr:glycosyltransferase family 39 protein [Candidatus Baltobacteraceae bacterium]